MRCWRCEHADLEMAKWYYGSEDPRRPWCEISPKGSTFTRGDIPDPLADCEEEGWGSFEDRGRDIRGGT
jgi:hypothetical protein